MSTNPVRLTDPDDLPGADVVVWDGKCRFCRGQVERLARFDRGNTLVYMSLHDPRVSELCPNLDFDQLMEQLWVIVSDGHQYGGAEAGRYLSRKLPQLWWLMPLLHIPLSMPLWRWIYKKVAQRRYRLAGNTCDEEGVCDVHR